MASFHISQEFFFRKIAFSRRHQESLPRMKLEGENRQKPHQEFKFPANAT